MKKYYQNYISGKWVDGGAGRLEVDNPATVEIIAEHAVADSKDVDAAVQAAQAMHQSRALSSLRPVERHRMVRKMGDYIDSKKHELAELLTLEQGKPLWESLIEIEGAVR